MIEQPYPYFALKEHTQYVFKSIGEKAVIKIVIFTPLRGNIWNLGFGDLENDGFINDTIITNNQDASKVLRTVAKIAIDFLAKHPNYVLEIKPVDGKRKRLYNGIFQRYFEEMSDIFQIIGILGRKKEPYTPSKIYDKFRITYKF